MDVVAAGGVALAILALGLGLRRGQTLPAALALLVERELERHARRLQQARIPGRPHTYLVMTLAAPIGLFAVGWLASPALAILAALAGFFVPRLYLGSLVLNQARRSEAEAPRLLQALLASLSAGSTYLDALRQGRRTARDPWICEDLDYVTQRFLLDVPLHQSLRDVRRRVASRNLGLIWETLMICAANHIPTQAARTLLFELASTVQFNVQLANEVRARSSGQRIQIWLLAFIVPGMYLYLRLLSPELLSTLDQTTLGRYLLFPAAACLEVLGLVLSFRITRFEA